MDRLTIPASYTVNKSQPDLRKIDITLNLLFEGACYGKHLFSADSVNAAVSNAKNIPIIAEDESCAVGVIPETISSQWTLMLVNGKWRNYLQIDAQLWTKLADKLPDLDESSDKTQYVEVELTDIDAKSQNDGLYTVSQFTISGCRLTSQQPADYTSFCRRYGDLPIR